MLAMSRKTLLSIFFFVLLGRLMFGINVVEIEFAWLVIKTVRYPFSVEKMLALHIFSLRISEIICLTSLVIDFGLEPPAHSTSTTQYIFCLFVF